MSDSDTTNRTTDPKEHAVPRGGEQDLPDVSPRDESTTADPPRIRWRAVLLSMLSIAVMFFYAIQVSERQRSGAFTHSQYPLTAFIPFVVWLVANVILKRVWPRIALNRGELLTIFTMTWVAGVIPSWIKIWASVLTTPTVFASPENQWETIFDFLPWHVLAPTAPEVVVNYWYGRPEGMEIPWVQWIGPLFQWLGATTAVVVFGFCLVLLFQRQWERHEKLTFPLAQLPLDLTQGLDGPRRMPDLFRSSLFWTGFFLVLIPMGYRITTYFMPSLPVLDILWKHYALSWGDGSLVFRVVPVAMAVVYLCPLDIMGSIALFHVLGSVKYGLMRRHGAPDFGFSGSSVNPTFPESFQVLQGESYGAVIFIALWSIWLARRHLKDVWKQVRSGTGDRADLFRYRLALVGMLVSAAYVIFWAIFMGVHPLAATLTFLLMALVYFVTVKLIAATGFAYLLPNRPHLKGEFMVVEMIGSAYMSARNLAAYKVFTSYAFFGHILIPAWPALPHHLRIFSFRKQPAWVMGTVLIAFVGGFLVAFWALLDMTYTEGAIILSGNRVPRDYNVAVNLMNNPIEFHWEKWALWFIGFFESAFLVLLRTRYHWFPIHPIGLAFQMTIGTWVYWSTLFMMWMVKITLLRLGGVKMYLAGKPFFYGMGIGYMVGVIAGTVVDLIWFPGAGHRIHWW